MPLHIMVIIFPLLVIIQAFNIKYIQLVASHEIRRTSITGNLKQLIKSRFLRPKEQVCNYVVE